MNKLTLFVFAAGVAVAGFAPHSSAQGYDRRIDVPQIVNEGRDYREERAFHGNDDEGRARSEIDRLLGEVHQVRREIGDLRDRRIRERFHSVTQAAERLSYAYDHHRVRGWEVRQRADEIRSELYAIRRELGRRPNISRDWR